MKPNQHPKLTRSKPQPLNLNPSKLVLTLHQLGFQWINPQSHRQLPTACHLLTLHPLPSNFLTLFSPN